MGQALGAALKFCRPPLETGMPSRAGESKGTDPALLEAAMCQLRQQQPRSVSDYEAERCYDCSVRFDVLVRRHHCRRCRSIYCNKCSTRTDRVLMYGEEKAVRLCNACAEAVPSENEFVEWHVPLLLGGTELVKQAMLARRRVYLRVTSDLSALEERELSHDRRGGRGETARRHRLDEVESVASLGGQWGLDGGRGRDGTPPLLAIRLRGKGQLKLEARSPTERDQWVSALGEAVRWRLAPPLASEVEEERWARKEKSAHDAQKLANAKKRKENEISRARIAVKYGLDPNKYASRERRSRSPPPPQQQKQQQQQQQQHQRRTGGFRAGAVKGVTFEGAAAAGGVLKSSGFRALAAMAR